MAFLMKLVKPANWGICMKVILHAVTILMIALCFELTACQVDSALANGAAQDGPSADSTQQNALIIENDPQLPDTYPGAGYEARLFARGGVPPLHCGSRKARYLRGSNSKTLVCFTGRPSALENSSSRHRSLTAASHSKPCKGSL